MAKDPAFLFYSKDWLEGTMEMTPEEKGIYIDLLAHQHQKGSLPTEPKRLSKLVGISEVEFLPIWADLKSKFIVTNDNRLVNRKLNGIVTERLDRGWRNTITGTLAAVVKKSGLPYELTLQIRKSFKIDDFLGCDKQTLTERITEWFNSRSKVIANGNGNENENEYNIGVMPKGSLTYRMVTFFKDRFPNYPIDVLTDYSSCMEIAYKIAGLKSWTKESVTNGRMLDVIDAWTAIVNFGSSDEWFSTRSISDYNKEFQRLIQKMSANAGNKPSHAAGSKRNAGAAKIRESLKRDLDAGGKQNNPS